MRYISSDTNVWIDFATIGKTEMPFKLPCTFIMSREAIEDELLSPPGLGEALVNYGLIPVEITIDEFYLADFYGTVYKKLSAYDRIALAIAKARSMTLLTGDAALRKAGNLEGVPIMGTLGLMDELWKGRHISNEEYKDCLQGFLDNNGRAIRLPSAEIVLRLNHLTCP